jgi:hypothetical protein
MKGLRIASTPWYCKSRESDLNRRPADYESAALPLCYPGINKRLFYQICAKNVQLFVHPGYRSDMLAT